MSAFALATLRDFGELTPSIAERWVAASLAQAAALREYDNWLYPADPARQVAAEKLHDAWRSWAEDAQSVLREAESLAASGPIVLDIGTLRDVLTTTRAMLRLTPSLIAQRREQMLRGEVYSMEEVRSELRAGNRR